MATHTTSHHSGPGQAGQPIADPLAMPLSEQRRAVVWFIGASIVGALLAYNLGRIDSFMYRTNAEVLDYDSYRANRSASTGIPSEVDPRQMGDLGVARSALREEVREELRQR